MTTAEQVALILRAVDHFAGVWGDGYLADDIADKFTCAEMDALVGLFTAAGHADVANVWLDAHAHGDEPEDAHYRGDGA